MNDTTVDWNRIDTILLDMDGTLLDLHFDSHFWLDHLPRRYAEIRGLPEAEAREALHGTIKHLEGRLEWYCLDHWRDLLDMDIVALKREVAHLIAVHPHVTEFLDAARLDGKQVWLVTNAHYDSLELKMERTGLGGHFDRLICSHEFRRPKEDRGFWGALRRRYPFTPERTLFVDDNIHVLDSAREYGIRHCLAVRHPGTGRPRKDDVGDYPAIEDFRDLLPGGSLRIG